MKKLYVWKYCINFNSKNLSNLQGLKEVVQHVKFTLVLR